MIEILRFLTDILIYYDKKGEALELNKIQTIFDNL